MCCVGCGQADERRHRWIDRALHLGEHGADARPAAHRPQRFACGQPVMHWIGVVTAAGADDRADDDELVHAGGDLREDLADLNAGHVGVDRLELAANFGRRFGLDVPHILMRRPAAEEDIDDGFVPTAGRSAVANSASFSPEDVSKIKAGSANAEGANAQETTARDAVTEAICLTEDGEHGVCSPFAEGNCGPQRFAEGRRERNIGGYNRYAKTPAQVMSRQYCDGLLIDSENAGVSPDGARWRCIRGLHDGKSWRSARLTAWATANCGLVATPIR